MDKREQCARPFFPPFLIQKLAYSNMRISETQLINHNNDQNRQWYAEIAERFFDLKEESIDQYLKMKNKKKIFLPFVRNRR